MQQYYELEEGTLTVFHRPDQVSFDREHFGGGVIEDLDKLRGLYEGDLDQLLIKDRSTMKLTRTKENKLHIHIDGRRETEFELTSDQFDTLIESLGSGDDSVGYDVESVGFDGDRRQ